MKSLARILGVIGMLALLLIPNSAQAADFRAGENALTVPREQTVNDNLYIAGDTVTVSGTVNGDVVTAGSDVTIEGTVNGSVWVLSGAVTITGTVQGSVRAGAGTVVIKGTVAQDVLAGSGDVTIGPGAAVGRDLVVGSGSLSVGGAVARNLKVASDKIDIAGSVGGSVNAESGEHFRLAAGSKIGGEIKYSGSNELVRDPAAQVTGPIDFTKSEDGGGEKEGFGSELSGQIYWFLASLILLAGILIYARRAALRAAAVITERPGKTVLVGLAFTILTPIALFILLITLVGAPLSAIGLMGYIVMLYSAKIFVALAIGQLALRRNEDSFWFALGAGTLGLALFYVLCIAPGIGWIVGLATVLFGTGAQLLLMQEVYGANRKKFGS